jgi:hypothetical protein
MLVHKYFTDDISQTPPLPPTPLPEAIAVRKMMQPCPAYTVYLYKQLCEDALIAKNNDPF